MNTYKRLVAMRAAQRPGQSSALRNPACAPSLDQLCEHTLVDQELNERLYAYEQRVRGRFAPILGVLMKVSTFQHEPDFVAQAQRLSMDQLGYLLPEQLLQDAWINGLDMRTLHAHCIFQSFKRCIDHVRSDQADWASRMSIDMSFIEGCGYHTVDISPCADGRLQGLLPFVLRMSPCEAISVKAYAGALFDVEADIADWTHRELERVSGAIASAADGNYLKIAVYHYSSSNPCEQGCAAHGSDDSRATEAAAARLNELRAAIDNTFGLGAAPDTLLIGIDTDIDAIRVHLPDAHSVCDPLRFVESAKLFYQTLGQNQSASRLAIAQAVADADRGHGVRPGIRRLIERLLEANFSQIQYVIQHHDGRYADIGHNERFICVGEAMTELQLRNKFYFAHLDTVEEGAADLDVGIKIFSGLNVSRGLPIPLLVHFHFSARVPGSRERAVLKCYRVRDAILSRYRMLHEQGLLHCQMAVSDAHWSERCSLLNDPPSMALH